MTDPSPPIQPTTPPGSKTLIYAPQVRIVIASGGKEIDVSKDIIRGRVTRAIDAVSQAEFYLNNKNGKYTGKLRRMDKVVIKMKRVTWITVFSGYLDIVPAYDLFPTEAYVRASCTLKRLKYTYWDRGLPASLQLLNPNINIDADQNVIKSSPDAATGIIIHDLLTKVGGWPANQVMIQQIPVKFMDFMRDNIELVGEEEVFNRLQRYLQTQGFAGGVIYPWTSSAGNVPAPLISGKYSQTQVISLIKGIWAATTSGVSESKIELAAAYAMKISGGDAKYHKDDTASSGRDMYGLFGLDHKGISGKTQNVDQLYDPVANIKQAWIASSQGTNWTYWSSTLGLGNPPSTLVSINQQASSVDAYDPNRGLVTNSGTYIPGDPSQTLFKQFYGPPRGENIDAVINYARSQLGVPYHLGSDGSDGHIDCSGLVMNAYKVVGLDLPHHAVEQARKTFNYQVPKRGSSWSINDLLPGDLMFFPSSAPDRGGGGVPDIGHVAIYIGNDQIIEAGSPVQINVAHRHLDGSIGYDYTANFITRPSPMIEGLNDNTGVWSNTNENGGSDASFRLFNLLFLPPVDTNLSAALQGDFGPANDEALLTSVAQICSGSMRSFMSGPNGDFIAFFPDYFGINKTQAVWDIEDVEIIDLKLQINDDELVTHVYTVGDTNFSQSIEIGDWIGSSGLVSIKMKGIMQQILAMQSNTGFLSDPEKFIQRYGLRPMVNQLSIIRSHYYEFFSSLYTFLQQWSKQFSTDVQICFMPELYPGMRMKLSKHDVCVYIESVTHTFDYKSGFQTYPTISCPSTPAGGSNGLPIAMGI